MATFSYVDGKIFWFPYGVNTCAVSSDGGVSWQYGTRATYENYSKVVQVGSRYFATCLASGTQHYIHSSDGINWTRVDLGSNEFYLGYPSSSGLIPSYYGIQFNSDGSYTNHSGWPFSTQNTPVLTPWPPNRNYFTVGENQKAYLTADEGVTLTDLYEFGVGEGRLNGITHQGDGKYLIYSGDGIKWTADHSTWTFNSWPNQGLGKSVHRAAFGGGLWLAQVHTQPNTLHKADTNFVSQGWTSPAGSGTVLAFLYGGGQWLAITDISNVLYAHTSPDASSWTQRTLAHTGVEYVSEVYYFDGAYYIIGEKVQRSTNGASWSVVFDAPVVTGEANARVNWMEYHNGTLYVRSTVGNYSGQSIYKSTNGGTAWSKVSDLHENQGAFVRAGGKFFSAHGAMPTKTSDFDTYTWVTWPFSYAQACITADSYLCLPHPVVSSVSPNGGKSSWGYQNIASDYFWTDFEHPYGHVVVGDQITLFPYYDVVYQTVDGKTFSKSTTTGITVNGNATAYIAYDGKYRALILDDVSYGYGNPIEVRTYESVDGINWVDEKRHQDLTSSHQPGARIGNCWHLFDGSLNLTTICDGGCNAFWTGHSGQKEVSP